MTSPAPLLCDDLQVGIARPETTEANSNLHRGFLPALPLPNCQHPDASKTISGSRLGELILPNGDIYRGTLLGNMPDGSGCYIWSNGCVYEGGWRRGLRHGQGKTLWPTGATYEGDYSGGYIYGEGTYIGINNSTYKGGWKLNLKHGLGIQTYPNGDMFEGSWIQGEIEGPGTYTWANGNTYVGTMKNGFMSGKGIFTWKNGDSFEGNWLDGVMHGHGVYTWKDCGYYVGTWTRGVKDGKGTLYPKCREVLVAGELYIDALRKRGVLPGVGSQIHGSCVLHSSFDTADVMARRNQDSAGVSSIIRSLTFEKTRSKNVSLERRWSLGAAIEKFIGPETNESSAIQSCENKADSNFPILEREYVQGVLISEVVVDRSFSDSFRRVSRRQKKMVKDIKKPGQTIIKGHRSYDLMLSLQLGIRYTVGKITPIQRRDVRASDYGPRASFWMNFPKNGSRFTPSHHADDFKWKEYCPMVFRNLREMFKIDAADYMVSISGSDALRELSSPGKSGSIFFLSQDDRFMIKTLRKSEVQVSYLFNDFRSSLGSNASHRIFLSQNILPYPIKNFLKVYILLHLICGLCNHLFICRQIETDSKFLRNHAIMDYSLLLGVHYRAPENLRTQASFNQTIVPDRLTVLSEEGALEEDSMNCSEGLVLVERASDENDVIIGPHIRGARLRSSASFEEVDLLLPGTARLQIQLGVNMPARAEQTTKEDDSKSFGQVYDVVLYLGIIDILQEYNLRKKIEHTYKSIKYNSLSISVVEPNFYSERFLKFIRTIFPESS
ncbi:Phosphatidylinositol 4-phosphate 5-kinase 9 [Dichanthelium oligosanthes]|uniref:Phosphatidylinositol 4-phosphate 5-kinase n=1 Tax=Dichanthelium oligosanthes TaxID=888268 RepID=A0A1E5WAX3_9POAL|nr:Phosphatidylinositol 4-phosphate 5-kinase 9 [Dichanthelium oligosanthes]